MVKYIKQPYSSLPFFLEKNYTALLTESFHVSVTYLQMHTRQITNQLSLENFLIFSFAITLEFRILKKPFKNKITGFVFLKSKI